MSGKNSIRDRVAEVLKRHGATPLIRQPAEGVLSAVGVSEKVKELWDMQDEANRLALIELFEGYTREEDWEMLEKSGIKHLIYLPFEDAPILADRRGKMGLFIASWVPWEGLVLWFWWWLLQALPVQAHQCYLEVVEKTKGPWGVPIVQAGGGSKDMVARIKHGEKIPLLEKLHEYLLPKIADIFLVEQVMPTLVGMEMGRRGEQQAFKQVPKYLAKVADDWVKTTPQKTETFSSSWLTILVVGSVILVGVALLLKFGLHLW